MKNSESQNSHNYDKFDIYPNKITIKNEIIIKGSMYNAHTQDAPS